MKCCKVCFYAWSAVGNLLSSPGISRWIDETGTDTSCVWWAVQPLEPRLSVTNGCVLMTSKCVSLFVTRRGAIRFRILMCLDISLSNYHIECQRDGVSSLIRMCVELSTGGRKKCIAEQTRGIDRVAAGHRCARAGCRVNSCTLVTSITVLHFDFNFVSLLSCGST